MKKTTGLFLILLAIAITLFTSCSTTENSMVPIEKDNSAPAEVSAENIETDIPKSPIGTPDNLCDFINVGEPCSYDLDGDGVKEEIIFKIENGTKIMDYGGGTTREVSCYISKLSINGIDCSLDDSDDFTRPSPFYSIIDIDVNDGQLQIALQDEYYIPPQSVSFIYGYSNGKTNYLGKIRGVFSDGYNCSGLPMVRYNDDNVVEEVEYIGKSERFMNSGDIDIHAYCLGDGIIHSHFPYVFNRWNMDFSYAYKDGKIVEIGDLDNCKLINESANTTLKDLTVYTEKAGNETAVLPAGTDLYFISLEDGIWASIETEDEIQYWVKFIENSFFDGVVYDGVNSMPFIEMFKLVSITT